MKRWPILLLLLSSLILSFASAHELVRDGRVGGLLHVAPDDEPRSGRPTDLFIELRELGTGEVTLARCGCRLNVAGPGGLDLPVRLTQDSGHLGARLTLPVPGVYTLTLTGRSAQPFKLVWVLRAGP